MEKKCWGLRAAQVVSQKNIDLFPRLPFRQVASQRLRHNIANLCRWRRCQPSSCAKKDTLFLGRLTGAFLIQLSHIWRYSAAKGLGSKVDIAS